MDKNEYLQVVLKSQNLLPESNELLTLQSCRVEVERLLRSQFENSSPTIRYGGSRAKGTINVESFDLDLICYFKHDDVEAGESLEDIYSNVKNILEDKYDVEPKTSALRLKGKSGNLSKVDFHIDVVPGRFVDEKEGDSFLYISKGEKKRLKTNLNIHINHVKDSGVIDAIRLLKLWKVRNIIQIKTFILELITIELLKKMKDISLSDQLEYVWRQLRDNVDQFKFEDPANPTGNDLSDFFNDPIRQSVSTAAGTTLDLIDKKGWEEVFGFASILKPEDKMMLLNQAASKVKVPSKPWLNIL